MSSPTIDNLPLRAQESAEARPRRDHSTYRFIRHYAEMVSVMFIGMFALMAPTGVLLSALARAGPGSRRR